MTSYIKDNHVVIKADSGKFLRRRDGFISGEEIILGRIDRTEFYDELPLADWAQPQENSVDENV